MTMEGIKEPMFETKGNTKNLKSYQKITYSLFIEYLNFANENESTNLINSLLVSLERSTKFYHRWFNWKPKIIVLDNDIYYQFNKRRQAPPPPRPKYNKTELIGTFSEPDYHYEVEFMDGRKLNVKPLPPKPRIVK